MLVVRVELHSAVTGQVTEIARMAIINDATSENPSFGDYVGRTYRGRDARALDRRQVHRTAQVVRHARLRLHVWVLVAKMLIAMGYAPARDSGMKESIDGYEGSGEGQDRRSDEGQDDGR